MCTAPPLPTHIHTGGLQVRIPVGEPDNPLHPLDFSNSGKRLRQGAGKPQSTVEKQAQKYGTRRRTRAWMKTI